MKDLSAERPNDSRSAERFFVSAGAVPTYLSVRKEYTVYKGDGSETEVRCLGETVYADILFLINFSMDFLCFYICSRVFGTRLDLLRVSAASALGGMYSVLLLVIDIGGAVELASDIAVLLLMCCIADPGGAETLRGKFGGALMYAGVSAALGGFMTGIYSLANFADIAGESASVDDAGEEISAWIFALLAASGSVAAVIGGRRLRVRVSSARVYVKVCVNEKETSFEGIVDSGNLLSDPLSGRPVIVCELGAIEGVIDPMLAAMLRSGGAFTATCGGLEAEVAAKLRFIPASGALGDGLLCAFLPDEISLCDHRRDISVRADALIAAVPRRLSADGCRALIPLSLMK